MGFIVLYVVFELIILKYVFVIFDLGVIIIFVGIYYVFRRKIGDNR